MVEIELPYVERFFEVVLSVALPIFSIALGIIYYALLVGIFYALYRVFAFVFLAGLKVWQAWQVIRSVMENPRETDRRIYEFLDNARGGEVVTNRGVD